MKPHLMNFLNRLHATATLHEAWDATVSYASGAGADWIHYAYAPLAARPSKAWPRLSSLPAEWLQHYEKSRFGSVDSNARHCKASVRALLAGPDFVKSYSSAIHRRWVDDSRGLGIFSEIVIPLRMLPGSGFGGFTFASRLRAREATRWARDMMPDLKLAVQFADVRMLQLAREREAARISLSPREREVLLWLAAGYRNDRIAERMRISNPTVELHLANARRKLNAATREQALALALLLGAISP
jgi:DNA-binding CsgD family transcriptional regulator